MKKILITPRLLTKDPLEALDLLRAAGYELVFARPGQQPTEDELVKLLPGCVGYLAGVERITARALQTADKLQVISRNGTGIDNIDLQAAEKLNIRICRAEGANTRGVAELTIGLLLALARSIPYCDRMIREGG